MSRTLNIGVNVGPKTIQASSGRFVVQSPPVPIVTSGSTNTDLTKVFRSFNYDALSAGTTPSDTGVAYHDSPVIDTTNVFNSTHHSVKHTLAGPIGSSGIFGDEWDYTFFPSNPNFQSGDEMWVARSFFVPTGFDFTAGSNLKWLRLANLRTNVTSNIGWLDFYITDTSGHMKHQNEFGINGGFAESFGSQVDPTMAALNYTYPVNQWVVFQAYAKFGTAGNGIIRAWADNTPIYENTTVATWSAGASVFYTYWQNFWNGTGIPSADVGNNMWSSTAAVAIHTTGRDDSSFLASDSRGNKYIKLV